MDKKDKWVVGWISVALLVNGLPVIANFGQVPPDGTCSAAPTLLFLLLLPASLATLIAIVSAMLLIPAMTRGLAKWVLLFCTVWIVSYFVGALAAGTVGVDIRHAANERLARRLSPVVDAIHDYEAKHSQPPDRLDVLGPEIVSRLPLDSKGKAGYEYLTGESAEKRKPGNRWVLLIQKPGATCEFRMFCCYPVLEYLPAQNYSRWTSRFGKWGYGETGSN